MSLRKKPELSASERWKANEERDLWRRCSEGGFQRARPELVQWYSQWMRNVAYQVFMTYPCPGLEWQDYVQYASIGLLEALDHYEPGGSATFRTYAYRRVRGAIIDGVRAYGDPACLNVGDSGRWQERVEEAEESDKGNLEQVADTVIGLALGYMLESESMPVADPQQSVYGSVEKEQLLRMIDETVDTLPEREAQLLRLHYGQQIKFSGIAELLGLSRGRVSQLHHRALQRLRKKLRRHWDPLFFA